MSGDRTALTVVATAHEAGQVAGWTRGDVEVKTYSPKASEVQRDWYVVDAAGKNLGRLATQIAIVLHGKHKATYTPHMDMGDYVIVLNADKIQVTGRKLDQKFYYRHSMYHGGFKKVSLRDQMSDHPDRVIQAAVRGMLPSTKLGRQMIKKMKVYAGSEHPHQAQQPKVLEV